MRNLGLLAAAVLAASAGSATTHPAPIATQGALPHMPRHRRYRAVYQRPVAGVKVARSLGHDGIYHTGALNKDNAASTWAKCWNEARGFKNRMAVTQRNFYKAMEAA